jgi:hypothetical protein
MVCLFLWLDSLYCAPVKALRSPKQNDVLQRHCSSGGHRPPLNALPFCKAVLSSEGTLQERRNEQAGAAETFQICMR